MKKSLGLLLVAVMLVGMVLTGCAGGGTAEPAAEEPAAEEAAAEEPVEEPAAEESVDEPAAEEAAAEEEPAAEEPAESTGETLSIMVSQDWVRDPETELADKFTEETGIAVDYQIVPADQYPNLLTTKLNSGECADIFMHQSGMFDIVSLLQIEKNGVDLSDEEWVGRFEEAVKDQVSVDGKVYGITIWDQGDSYAYIYNKQIFDELGLVPPTNYDEFKEVCQTVLDNDITPIFENVASGWHHQLNFFDVSDAYNQFDPELVDKLNTNETTFADNEVFAEMLTQMKEVVDAGYWGEYYMSNEYEDTPIEMASGEYAMTVNMMGRIGDIVEASDGEYTEEDFGIFPVPYLDNQVIAETPCGPSKFVYSGSDNIDLAKQYLEFLARPENLQYMIDNEESMNSLPFEGLESTYSAEVQEAMEKFKDGKSIVYQNAVIYLNPQWMEVGTDIAALLIDDIDVDEAVASIDQRRADQASAAGDENW